MQRIFLLAQETGEPIDRRITAMKDVPWSWVRVNYYINRIKNTVEHISVLSRGKPQLPSRWVFFDDEALDEYIEILRQESR